MKKLTTIFLLSFFIVPAYSQFKIKKNLERLDYVVNLEQDTLWGEVRYGNHVLGSRLNKIILFDENGNRHKFKAFEAKGFSNDNIYYTTIQVDGYSYFARKIVSGTVNMYFFEYAFASNYNTHYKSKSDDIGVQGKIVTVLLERDGNIQRVFRKKLSEDLYPFLGDNTELMNSVQTGECGFDELDQVVAAYNEWYEEK